MSGIYYVLIIFPILILFLLGFVFQSSVQQIKNEQFLLNCPMPIDNGVATIVNIVDGVRLNYTVVYSATQFTTKNYNGTFFECFIDPTNKAPSAFTRIKNYGAVLEFFGSAIIPYGWLGYIGDTIFSYLDNAQPFLTMIYLFFNAPAIVTGLAWFTYINVLFLGLIGFGIFLAVRG